MSREQALAYGELCLELVELVSEYVDLPERSLPDVLVPEQVDADDIATAAAAARHHWGLAPGPVGNVVQLLEAHGIVTMRLPDKTDRAVNAFSTDSGSRPLVFLSQGREDRARSRFDAAHELGHLLLHPDIEPGSKVVESQAQMFAAEFLMPREQIIDDLPRRIDWPTFHDLKRTWGVSLKSLVYRAHALGRLSDASYRRANQQLSIWGLPEPGPLGPAESPQLLGMARSLMIESGIDFNELLASSRLPAEITDRVLAATSADRPRVIFDGS
ncbi:hypothetical protein GCM10028771_24280 [Nocardioides marmoraquaticus]